MKDTITLKELAAILVRRGKLLIVFIVIFALLLGGWRMWNLRASIAEEYSPDKIEERYQAAVLEYQQKTKVLEMQLQLAQAREEYFQKSLLMKLDPYNKVVVTIDTFINAEGDCSEQTLSRLGSQYQRLWDEADLQEWLSHSAEDAYLREILFLKAKEGGILTLTAWGNTKEEAKRLAEDAYTYVLASQNELPADTVPHTLVGYGCTTSNVVDSNLESVQRGVLTRLEDYETQIEQLQQKLNSLVEPVYETQPTQGQMVKSAIKYSGIGAVLGAVFGMAWVIITYLFRNRVEISRHLEERTTIPVWGSIAEKKDIFSRIADRILGEKIWKKEDALAWISENVDIYLQSLDGTIALVSTLKIEEENPAVQKLKNLLQEKDFSVRFAAGVDQNPAVLAAIRDCNAVVLLERCGVSRWDAIQKAAVMTQELKKTIQGFVLI